MAFWERQTFGDKKFSSFGKVGGEMNKWSTEEFSDTDNTLSASIMIDICHYTFV